MKNFKINQIIKTKIPAQVPIYIYSVLCFTVSLCLCFNADLGGDAIYSYRNSLTNSYIVWHPPIYALLWRVLGFVYHAPQSMLILSFLMLFLGSMLISLKITKIHRVLAYIPQLFIFPFLIIPNYATNIAGFYDKGCSMLSFVMLFFGIMLHLYKFKGWKFNLLCLVCFLLLFYSTLVRYNAVFFTVFCFILLAYLFFGQFDIKFSHFTKATISILLGLFVCSLVFLSPKLIYKPLNITNKHSSAETMYYMDLLSLENNRKTADQTTKMVTESLPSFQNNFDVLRQKRQNCTEQNLPGWCVIGYFGPSDFTPLADDEKFSSADVWKKAVFQNPAQYFKIKLISALTWISTTQTSEQPIKWSFIRAIKLYIVLLDLLLVLIILLLRSGKINKHATIKKHYLDKFILTMSVASFFYLSIFSLFQLTTDVRYFLITFYCSAILISLLIVRIISIQKNSTS